MDAGEKKLEHNLIIRLKNNKLTLKEMCEVFKRKPEEIKGVLDKLKEKHVRVNASTRRRDGELVYNINVLPESGNVYHISGADKKKRTMKIAASADYHFASTFQMPKTFHEAMKRTVDEGITKVYVAGDIVDGKNIYRGHLENLVTASVEGQTDMAAEALSKYPELEFWAIAGNHDYSFTKLTGSKPLSILEAKIDNFKNLGDLKADVIYRGIRIRLLHGASGRTYATSYPSQTYLRDYFKGLEREDMTNIPHLMILGHFHTLYHGKDHGMYIIQPGSFQDSDNEFCVRRGLTGPNGLFHLEMEFQDGMINEFAARYIQPRISRTEKGSAFSKTTKNYRGKRR
jgi:predicted phosphodiesterase